MAASLNKEWTGHRGKHLDFEDTLEKHNLKRKGDRRDQKGGGGRTYGAWFFSLGLYFKKNKVAKTTLAGEALLNDESPIEVLKHQIIKFQYPSPYSIVPIVNVDERFKIRPFMFLLKLLIHNDIEYLTKEEIAKLILTEADNESDECFDYDGFSFGFPCNDFSIVGKHKGFDGEYGPLYTYGVKVLRHHQPKWFVAENVGGLESANGGKAFYKILDDLENEGYVLTPHLYKFHEYGVPQKRHRIIIVGIRKDLGLEFKVPHPTHGDGLLPFVNVRDAFESNPIPTDAFNNEKTRHTAKVIEMLSHIPPGKNAWYEGIPEELRLNVKKTRMSQIYKRLHPELPSYTVTGSGGGGTHMYHYNETRALTNRERARLQTFPDNYEFIGPKEQVRKQIGMAVPTLGAKAIFEAILKTFAGIDYEYIEPRWKAAIEEAKRKKKETVSQPTLF